MDENDNLLLLSIQQGYLELMLKYQRLEDYLFQCAYKSKRGSKGKAELKMMKFFSLHELIRAYTSTSKFASLSQKDKDKLYGSLYKTIALRNYYVHQFFYDVYFEAYDAKSKTFAESKLEDLEFKMMKEGERLDIIYDRMLEKVAPHHHYAYRHIDISSFSSSLTYASLSKEEMGSPYEDERKYAFPSQYWALSYGYFALESSLYGFCAKIETKYHSFAEEIAKSLSSKSFTEYGKYIELAYKKEPLFAFFLDDHLANIKSFFDKLSSLSQDRNYWTHFCLSSFLNEQGEYSFNEVITNASEFNRLNKSYALLLEVEETIYRLEEDFGS